MALFYSNQEGKNSLTTQEQKSRQHRQIYLKAIPQDTFKKWNEYVIN